MDSAAPTDGLVNDYLRLGLRFDRIEEGFVDAYTGDPALRREVLDEPAPDPARLAAEARRLRANVDQSDLPPQRREFISTHLRALECSGRKLAGEEGAFIDEVRDYFDVEIGLGDPDQYRQAHRDLDALLPGAGDIADRMRAHRASEEIPPERLEECVAAFSSALRDIVRTRFGLPASEQVVFDVVTDKPWSGFNYYEGRFRSTVAINADLRQHTSSLPHLIAHEAYPGHHTEHCHKDIALVEQGQAEQTIFLVNTPQCLMAEGLADLALRAATGEQWGTWAQEIYADLGIRFDGERAQRIATAASGLLTVRQDAAIMLHDRHADADEVAAFLQRWLLITPQRSRQTLRFLTSPLWRAYVSTYVEGYQLLRDWLRLDVASTPEPGQAGKGERFARLLDEPLLPGALRADLARAGR
ncbi:DUF885 domain-containing protein [Hoyosella sp. G463]|uniref:DUF885 domain-containing protein n=1 Tax=Lolliginicoccus lacisalsi TaxID=2742202 RepID=A0A927JBV6_9ACTN|nr:DUF885 domain-containing protein [Lolliginicoccus lacisalsi]MBD8506233.1 DUF885 domain-containing protein [Lolliginicoccus lacisalsi]